MGIIGRILSGAAATVVWLGLFVMSSCFVAIVAVLAIFEKREHAPS